MEKIKQVYFVMEGGDLIIPNIDQTQNQEFEIERYNPNYEREYSWFSEKIPTFHKLETNLKLKIRLDANENYTKFYRAGDDFNKGVAKYLDDEIERLETLKENLN